MRTKLLPYFKDKKMREIKPKDIIQWQNKMLKMRNKTGNKYAPTYLKTLQAELSALFNHAVRFYELKSNPVVKAGPLGKDKADEMLFWTKEDLAEELQAYINTLYGILPTDRIFHITKSFLYHEMTRGSLKAGVKRIRIHDLRHSHASLLINMGFSAVVIGNRVGHESLDITFRYAHMFPAEQSQMALKLNDEFKEGTKS